MDSLPARLFRLCLLLVASGLVLSTFALGQATSVTGERGKKLVLKDGTFQLVREYQRNGERVRYFSAERADWEEIPAAMVDWDATAKAAAASSWDADALAATVHHQEEQQRIEAPLDVDASLP